MNKAEGPSGFLCGAGGAWIPVFIGGALIACLSIYNKGKANTDKAGTGKVGADETGTGKVGADEAGTGKAGADEGGTGKAGADY